MATYIKIASNTVGSGGAASVTFSSIPSTYTDLVVKMSTRSSSGGSVAANTYIKFNGSSASYSERLLYGDGTTPNSASQATTQFNWAGQTTAGTATASTFNNSEVYIPNYTSANYKSISADSVTENNATAASIYIDAGLWSNTSAITSIAFTEQYGANFAQYSTFTLYGISNA